jgi:methionyl-tRNA formyltransferase
LIRPRPLPYPNAFTFYRGERIRILQASVHQSRYGDALAASSYGGCVFIREGNGVVIVAGADARRGRNRGLTIERVRTDNGSEYAATECFRTLGGYLTSHP